MLENAFHAVQITSLAGTVLTVLLLLLRPLTGRFCPAAFRYYAWVAVLAVLVLPVRISLPAAVVELPASLPTFLGGATAEVPQAFPVVDAAPTVKETALGALWQAHGTTLLAWLWCGGAWMLFGVKAVGYAVYRRRLLRGTRPVECAALSQYTRWKVRVRAGKAVSAPLLMGLFRPTLFLPDLPLTLEQTAHILSHEMTHLRRGDVWIKWFATAVKCVHWFNPAAYVVHRQLQAECEISCDLAAVKHMSREGAVRYLHTILFLVSTKSAGFQPLATEMVGNGRLLKRRFCMVKQQQTYRRSTVWLCGGLVALLTVGAICGGGLLAGRAEAEVAPAAPLATHPEVIIGTTTGSTTGTTTESTAGTTTGATAGTTTGATTVPTTPPAGAVGRLLWPCPGNGQISSGYGYRWGQLHNGIDISVQVGDPVVAAAGGVVTEVATGGYNGGYGQYVRIDHGGGLVTQYAHLSGTAVQVGDTVTAGQTVGAAGMTGKVTGPCLHFTVLVDGAPVDPEDLLS